MILKTHYSLPFAESKLSGGDQIESDSLEALADGQEISMGKSCP